MSRFDKFIKRTLDIILSFFGLLFTGWLIILSAIIACFDTNLSGFFVQTRIGIKGKPFKVYKIRSMKNVVGFTTNVSTDNDPRITTIGKFWRKTKIDELPQLINVFIGNMSFVGPRPDVPGYADKLIGEDRIILSIRPGITGPASIHFKNEEEILASQPNPEEYNRNVIWPKKVELNKEYIKNYSIVSDFEYIIKTLM